MQIKHGIVMVWLFLLIGCSQPLPPEKLNYAGEWSSKEMYLLILEDGSVNYERLKNGMTISVTGPMNEFNGHDFVVGFGPFTTTFVVSEPPHTINGEWQMVVDGVRLTRHGQSL